MKLAYFTLTGMSAACFLCTCITAHVEFFKISFFFSLFWPSKFTARLQDINWQADECNGLLYCRQHCGFWRQELRLFSLKLRLLTSRTAAFYVTPWLLTSKATGFYHNIALKREIGIYWVSLSGKNSLAIQGNVIYSVQLCVPCGNLRIKTPTFAPPSVSWLETRPWRHIRLTRRDWTKKTVTIDGFAGRSWSQ